MNCLFKLRNHLKLRSAFTVFFMALLLSAGVGSSSAQEVDADTLQFQSNKMSLTQAIQIALANNVQIKRALLSVKDADQQARTAWSEALPEISASANYTRNLEVPVNFIPEVVFNPDGDPNNLIPVAFGTDNNWSGGITVSQTLFDGQVFVGINSSKVFKTVQAESLRTVAQQIVTQTRQAYYSVLIAKEQVRLQETQIERIEQNLEDSRARYEQGLVDNYAVLQLEVQLGNLRPQLTQAEFDIDEARRNLLDVMGLPVKLPIQVEGDLNTYQIRGENPAVAANASLKKVDNLTPLELQADSSLIELAKGYRGDLRLVDLQQQLQEKQIKANQSEYLPTLSATYNLQYTAAQPGRPIVFGTEDQRARSQTVMLSLSVPIFQGFQRDATIQRAKIQLKDLELLEYQRMQDARSEITEAEESIREVYETSTAREKALDQSRTGYDRALKRYEIGLGSQQEVTDAQLQLRQAELNYSQMVFNYLTAKAQYDLAIGMVPYVDNEYEAVRNDVTD